MTATVIALPVAARIEASGLDEVTLQVRLPRRVFNRLVRTTAVWDLGPTAAAQILLTQAINEVAGVGKRK